jgi:hypothetical protein
MSDLYFNIRFGSYHYQFGPKGLHIKYNDCHSKINRKSIPNWKWFQIYEWFDK